jgi:DNA-binding winged helix-turn-helix (wHTH) protein/predicted ATPase
MSEETSLCFGPFHLDLANESVWRGQEALKLTRKGLAVLRYLVEHAGQLVTKDALFTAVWPEVVVGDAALTVCIRELRQMLGDDRKAPQYIETVYGRGYRWIAPLSPVPAQCGAWSVGREAAPLASVALRSPLDALRLVGREAELTQLQQWLDQAMTGQRQIVFITGEPGIGKTTVVEGFLHSLGSRVQSRESEQGDNEEANQKSKGKRQKLEMTDPRPLPSVPQIGRGQCINHYGAGEGYLPILTALDQLCREMGHERLLSLLRQYAPLWLVQLPSVLSPQERERLQRETQGVTRERMLREMGTLLEVLTAETPLLLVLEDLHWSDPSTIDLLALIARRQEPARLLLIGTYRPSEVFASEHPLRTVGQELLAHKQCYELALEGLSEAAVEQYLEQRFPVQVFPARLTQVLQQRTEGNPLFLTNLVDDLVLRGVLTDGEGGWMVQGDIDMLLQQVPDSSRQLITAQMARVSPATQQTLAAASVAGVVFSAAAVAAALDTLITEVETRCEEVTRQQLFVQRAGIETWPDGTVAARYGFRHALYQELWHEQGTVNQRQEWHQRIGLRKELAYNGRASEIAAELAVHFEQGRNYQQAIYYLQQAAQQALQRSANMEAIGLLTKGLKLLQTLPDTPERTEQELRLRITQGGPLIALKGFAAPEMRVNYDRALELCQRGRETLQSFPVLWGLCGFYSVRAEWRIAQKLAEQLFTLAQSAQDPVLLLEAHYALGQAFYLQGEFVPGREHLEQVVKRYDPQQYRSLAFVRAIDPGVMGRGVLACALWCLGYPDQARRMDRAALTLGQEVSQLNSLAYALYIAVGLYQFCRDEHSAQERAEELITLSTEQGFALYLAFGMMVRGWALVAQGQGEEGIAQMRQGLAAHLATGAENARSRQLVYLAWAYGEVGQAEEGLNVLTEALDLVQKTGERHYEAEAYRLKGELTLAQSSVQSLGSRVKKSPKFKVQSPKLAKTKSQILNPKSQEEAEAYFHKAIEVARKQQAKSLELRATVSLARLWQRQGKLREAHQMLTEIYGWFTEGFDTKDLQEAKVLLESLA